MAKFAIDASNSVTTTIDGVHAFAGDTPGADSLTIAQGGYLIATGVGSRGASLENSQGWKVTVHGSIKSEKVAGLFLDGGPSKSTVTIGASGDIQGVSGSSSNAKPSSKTPARSLEQPTASLLRITAFSP